ncbi:ABC transporter permease [Rhodobacter sp. Har01]|uniref:ABC transporter permease n=1 Tax=Rhodobacter sp. Har01 TaxID=2883999 RepID=UPI001D06E06A|nr:ABC transporter permease [Rhodobacter sp. Har01]MCB6179340.1 ABC transporter permease [Rhodobacter sp. Har01]
MRNFLRSYPSEAKLLVVLLILCTLLAFLTPDFLTLVNLTSLLNNNSVNVIWAVGLLVVLIAGGIDISFAVAASVVQYICVYVFAAIGGGNWAIGLIVAGGLGMSLGLINAFLIHQFRIISIVVTISTFNAFFGLLMFITSGRFLYNLPSWWSKAVYLWEKETPQGWADIRLPVAVMAVCMVATWFLIRHTTTGRQLYAFGDNPEGARRAGISIGLMQAIAFGWCGMMAGIAGLMQANITKEVVPMALIGRELDVLAAVVLGGARLGGGRGSILGCFLGVALVAVTQNGLNLLGVSPYAFKMVVGAIILLAISTSNLDLARLVTPRRKGRE